MGYDMYMLERSKEPRTDNRETDEDVYFRANIWGMGILRGAMKAAGVMDMHHGDVKWLKVSKEEEAINENAWEEKNGHLKRFRSKTASAVPIGKFCSNDGWVVVPDECLIIANGLDTLLKAGTPIVYRDTWEGKDVTVGEEDLKYVQEFADYCRRASTHGGFEVW